VTPSGEGHVEAIEGIPQPQNLDRPRSSRLFAHRQGQSRTIVYISGQVPNDSSGKIIGEGDFEAQVEQIFRNLKIAVEAAGGTMADIVKLNYYLVAEVDQAIVLKLRPIRDRYLNVENPPASTFVVVSRLMRPGWLIEIEAVAAIDA
jgi:enamine deaminase RidA (YjgF/YER057c/UK114 family)